MLLELLGSPIKFAVEIFLPDGKGLAETEVIADSVQYVLAKDEPYLS